MEATRPFGLVKEEYLLLDKNNVFSVDFHHMNKEYFCVMDVYPVVSPTHPQRHPGWFRFDRISENLMKFKLTYTNNQMKIESLAGIPVTDFWISDSLEENDIFPLSIRIVIRKKINNEIVFEDKIICYASEAGYLLHKGFFEQQETYLANRIPTNLIIPKELEVGIILKSFVDGDAIGYFSWEAYSLLKKQGINVKLYVQTCEDKFRPFVHHIEELLSRENLSNDTMLFYNYSIQDDYLEDILKLGCKKVAYFHGITNPKQLRVFDAELAEECMEGLKQLYRIENFDMIMVNSETTRKVLKKHLVRHKLQEKRDELLRNGCNKYGKIMSSAKFAGSKNGKIKTIPPTLIGKTIWDYTDEDGQFEKSMVSLGDVILYVGRMYPHKHVEDVIEVFREVLKDNTNAVLVLVGGTHNSYQKYLKYKISRIEEKERERIIFMQQLSRNQLKAAYQAAKIFITMSEDEGFCVPVLEAMNFHVPVLARQIETSAATEILEKTGKIVCNKDFASIAAEINYLLHDAEYRQAIVSLQDERAKDFADIKLSTNFVETLLGCYYDRKNFI